MKFNEKMLIACMAVLVICMTIRTFNPMLAEVFSFDFIIFFTGMLSTMTFMHFVGWHEGYKEGLKIGKTTLS